jgi:hypothetical protein
MSAVDQYTPFPCGRGNVRLRLNRPVSTLIAVGRQGAQIQSLRPARLPLGKRTLRSLHGQAAMLDQGHCPVSMRIAAMRPA